MPITVRPASQTGQTILNPAPRRYWSARDWWEMATVNRLCRRPADQRHCEIMAAVTALRERAGCGQGEAA